MPTRKVTYLGDINRILKDERLSPNRRSLMAVLKIWINMEPGPEKEWFRGIIDAQFGNPQRTRWTDAEDSAEKESQSNITKEADATIKNIFSEALKERSDETVLNPTPGGG